MIQAVRQSREQSFAQFRKLEVNKTKDLNVPVFNGSIKLRIYYPNLDYDQNQSTSLPFIMYYHGGGFVFSSLETHDYLLRKFVNYTKVAFVAVEYRKAPEHKYPIPIYDCIQSTEYFIKNAYQYGLNPNKVGLAGDSAGGNIVAILTHHFKNQNHFNFNFKIQYQMLIYPLVIAACSQPSCIKNQNAPILSLERIHFFYEQYLNKIEETIELQASPYFNEDFKKLPKQALIIIASLDPLRDQGVLYHEKLLNAGYNSKLIEYTSFHGFFGNHYFDQGEQSILDASNDIILRFRDLD